MKEIIFEFLELKSLSGKVEVANIKEDLAELIYSRFGGLKYKLLAEKIYKSPSPCELDEGEVELLKGMVSPETSYLPNKVSDALMALLEKEGKERGGLPSRPRL